MMLNLPDISQAFNGNTNEQILDSLQKYRKELNFLLMNLDESNMPSIAGRLDGIDGSFSLIQQDLSSITLAVGNAQGDISALSITVGGISTTVSNHTGQISTINQTVSGIQSTVSSHTTTIGTHTSQITQMSNNISSIVSFTDVTGDQIASKINQTATTISLSASKIDLTGITRIYDPANTAKYAEFTGNQLTLVGTGSKSLIFSNKASISANDTYDSLMLGSIGSIYLSATLLQLDDIGGISWGANTAPAAYA